MATYTPNYNLGKPEASDPFGNFRQLFNDNMDEIDANLGGGGGGGGHTIVDENGSDMPAESKLQFTGNVSVTDDNVNGATVVDVLGGGGNVYGAFLDPSRVIYSAFTFDSSTHSWTATEDCILTDNMTPPDGSTAYFIRIDGKQVFAGYSTVEDPFVYVKKGQVVEYRAKSGSTMKAYGITQGTNGIYAPVIYSDNERVIGVWRDNKPLYAKTINFGALPNSTTKDVSHGIANVDKIWISGGFAYQPNGDFSNQLALNVPNSLTSGWYFGANSSVVRCQTGSDRTNYSAFVTLYYTKTTDTAGSGNWNTDGVPTHHYSTSEQVVGTWIDGKPLYERTWDFSASPVMLSYANWVNSGISAGENIKSIMSAELKYGTVTNMAVEVAVGADGYPVAFQKVENTGNTRGIEYCTLRYTKTTD